MRHVAEGGSVAAIKALLRDLENTQLIYPDGLSILSLRRDLKAKIAELEKCQVTLADPDAQAMATD